jgi:CheY-like chemotaxis protein
MTILVAHENQAIRAVIEAVLLEAGYGVHAVADGAGCLAALDAAKALVLDVAVSGPFAFELIDAAKQRSLPVVLVASIYNRTSYKRRPTQLYGADDYVEQHHVPDQLVGKLSALVGAPSPTPSRGTQEAQGEAVRVAAEHEFDEGEAIERAVRLARLIVRDVALYNGDAVIAARRDGLAELEARLRVDLEEGRLLFDLRVPAAIRGQRDFIAEALHELVHREET